MKNREIHGYNSIPVSDTHIHIVFPKSPEETVSILRKFNNHMEYDSITVQTLTRCTGHRDLDPSNSLKGLYVKSALNSELGDFAYTYGSIFHYLDGRDTAESYLRQAEELYALGVDGYKFLDGKPGIRKMLGKPLCDPIFDKMYAFIEEHGMPVKLHLADPAKFWGPKETMTETAIKRGWWCGDGSFPKREEFYEELFSIMKKFPRLKLCLAHLGYMTYDEAVAFLEDYPNTSFDLTPGASWCKNATEDPALWREFIIKYSDRIFFGTDTYNIIEGEDCEAGYERSCSRYNTVRGMLEFPPERTIHYGGDIGDLTPIELDTDTLERIYYKNVRALLGKPREVTPASFIKAAEEMKALYAQGAFAEMPPEECEDEIRHLDYMISFFKGQKA